MRLSMTDAIYINMELTIHAVVATVAILFYCQKTEELDALKTQLIELEKDHEQTKHEVTVQS